MKCPKCGFHSFDYLESCKKCGSDLVGHKVRFGLASFLFPGRGRTAGAGESQKAAPLAATGAGVTIGVGSEAFDFQVDGEEGGEEPKSPAGQDEFGFGSTAEEDFGLDFSCGEKSAAEGLPELTAEADSFNFGAAADALPETRDEAPFSFDPFESLAQNNPEQTSTSLRRETGSQEILPVMETEVDLSGMFLDSLPDDELEPEKVLSLAKTTSPPAADFSLDAEMSESELSVDALSCDDIICEAAASPPASPPAAPVVRRLAAGSIDMLVLGLVFAPFVMAGGILLSPAGGDGPLLNLAALLDLSIPYFLVFFTVAFGYFTLFHFLTGQTPGKMLLKLRVEDIDGDSLFFSQAFLRSVGGLLSLLSAGVGFLLILSNADRRGWSDRLAGSRVVPAASGKDPEEPFVEGFDEEEAGTA